ncbi:unnamed protein product [Urochloa decumbens]|uniref:[RNA-polymerase]-subunit kinase n=1 Tax=Urochloa decumbens TaxID=240449 RepID=A0ABC9FZV6_9POAL
MAAAVAAFSRKRPAADAACAVAMTATKKSRAPVPYRLRSIDEYEQLEVLGKGSYGVVVKARDRRTGDTVAVKSNRVGGTDDLIREAGFLVDCLGHPSIVQIRDVAADAASGELFLVMELVSPSLHTVLRRRRCPFSEAETRRFMRQLLGAAAKLHGGGTRRMVHRDIKPANILVTPSAGGDTVVKLCDFGAAAPALPARTPYPEDERVGTLLYRSPEQLRGSRCYGPAVDVWALGCVMFELLAGEPLFAEAYTDDQVVISAVNLRDDILYYGPETFRGLPEPLSESGAEVLCGLLCYDHEQRSSAAEALKQRWFTEDGAQEEQCSAVADLGHPGNAPWLSETQNQIRHMELGLLSQI